MTETQTDKTLYDGRLLTHQRLNSGWNAYNNFLLIKNYEGCITALSVVLTNSVGALNNDSILKYQDRLETIYNKASMIGNGSKVNPNSVSDFIIKKELLQWSIDIMKETKNLYLPYEINDVDYDEDKFLSESG